MAELQSLTIHCEFDCLDGVDLTLIAYRPSLFVDFTMLPPKKLSDRPEMLSKSCHGILKFFYLTEFSSD